MYKFVNPLALALMTLLTIKTTHTAGPSQKQLQFTPKNTGIAFDIDEVLLQKNYGKKAQEAWDSDKLSIPKKALYDVSTQPISSLYSFLFTSWKCATTGLIWGYQKISGQELVSFDRFVESLEGNAPNFAQFLKDNFATLKEPIPGTATIIEELKQKGYTLYIASNVGTEHYEKLKATYPELFEKFTAAKVVPYKESYQAGNRVIKKPDRQYFQDLKQMVDKENIIFIDDKVENTNMAQLTGMTGIHYTGDNDNLRNKFVKLGMLDARNQ